MVVRVRAGLTVPAWGRGLKPAWVWFENPVGTKGKLRPSY